MEINTDIYLFGSILFLIIAILVFDITHQNLIFSGLFVLCAINIFVYPYFKEVNVKDYQTIVNLKNSYPEISKEVDLALSDGKISVKEGADIWELTQKSKLNGERLNKEKALQDVKDKLNK
ncbi:MAG: hypothetical protein AB7S47_00160 [Desulfurella sp.]